MHGVEKMDPERNSQEGKLEIWKGEGLGVGWGEGVNEDRKDHGFGLGTI